MNKVIKAPTKRNVRNSKLADVLGPAVTTE